MHVSARLQLDGRPDLLDREAGDRHTELACRHQVSDVLDGPRSGVSAVRRGGPVDEGRDGGDPLVGHTDLPCRPHGLGPVQVQRRRDTVRGEDAEPHRQPVAVRDRLGPEGTHIGSVLS